MEDFVKYFVEMCRSENTSAQVKTRLRIAGLRGLRAYIVILDYADELDSFVSKQSQASIIPTILDNMQYEANEYVLVLLLFFLSFLYSSLPPFSPLLEGYESRKT